MQKSWKALTPSPPGQKERMQRTGSRVAEPSGALEEVRGLLHRLRTWQWEPPCGPPDQFSRSAAPYCLKRSMDRRKEPDKKNMPLRRKLSTVDKQHYMWARWASVSRSMSPRSVEERVMPFRILIWLTDTLINYSIPLLSTIYLPNLLI